MELTKVSVPVPPHGDVVVLSLLETQVKALASLLPSTTRSHEILAGLLTLQAGTEDIALISQRDAECAHCRSGGHLCVRSTDNIFSPSAWCLGHGYDCLPPEYDYLLTLPSSVPAWPSGLDFERIMAWRCDVETGSDASSETESMEGTEVEDEEKTAIDELFRAVMDRAISNFKNNKPTHIPAILPRLVHNMSQRAFDPAFQVLVGASKADMVASVRRHHIRSDPASPSPSPVPPALPSPPNEKEEALAHAVLDAIHALPVSFTALLPVIVGWLGKTLDSNVEEYAERVTEALGPCIRGDIASVVKERTEEGTEIGPGDLELEGLEEVVKATEMKLEVVLEFEVEVLKAELEKEIKGLIGYYIKKVVTESFSKTKE